MEERGVWKSGWFTLCLIGKHCTKGRKRSAIRTFRRYVFVGKNWISLSYLSQGDRPTRVSYLESAFSYIFRHFRATPERYVIRRGTKLLENVLLELKTFADHVTELSPRLIRNIAATISEIYQATELGKWLIPAGRKIAFTGPTVWITFSVIDEIIPLQLFFLLYINWMPFVPCIGQQ